MKEDILDLQDEINLLRRRIELLEKKNNQRQALFYVKLLIKIMLFLAIVGGLWYGYNYLVNEVPHILDEKIKEIIPIKKL